jgi:hypothetical protein
MGEFLCPHMLFANETRAETRAHVREPAPTVRSFATAACSSDTVNTSCSPVICVKSNASKRNEYGEEQHDLKTVPCVRTGRKKCNGRWRSETRIVCFVVCESPHSLSRPKILAPHLSLPYLSLYRSFPFAQALALNFLEQLLLPLYRTACLRLYA